MTKFPFSLEEFKALSPEDRFAAMSEHRANTGRTLEETEEEEPDHLPRCDCGHLFEICDYPRCPCAGASQ